MDRAGIAFDARALTEPVDRHALAEFTRGRRGGGIPVATIVAFVVIGLIAAVVAVPALVGVVVGLTVAVREGQALWPAVGMPVLVLLVLGIVGALLAASVRRDRIRRFRIARFAAANGMAYEDRVDDPPLPGMIFQIGRDRNATSLVRGFRPRFVEFGNLRYTTGSGKNSTTHTWGYVAVRLDVPLPNIVLDARGNNALGTNLPASFSRAQRLSLEGDFDRHFTLYCPQGYERDALYLFTPDIMARFIDHAAQLDVEIVDDWMFLYMQRPASTTDPATWAWLFGTVGALLTKFDQWARWRDDRLQEAQAAQAAAASSPGAAPTAGALPFAAPAGMLTPPPGVAAPGRRLKRGAPWAAIVAIAVMTALWVLPQLFLR